MLARLFVEFNVARPGRRNLRSLPQRGRAAILFRTTPATIHTIAKTGAMLVFGQECSNEKTALAAEPCCAPDCSCATPWSASSLTEFQAHTTTPKGWPPLVSAFSVSSLSLTFSLFQFPVSLGRPLPLLPASCWQRESRAP